MLVFGGSWRYLIGLKPVLSKTVGIYLTQGEIDNFTQGKTREVRLVLTSHQSDSSLHEFFYFWL